MKNDNLLLKLLKDYREALIELTTEYSNFYNEDDFQIVSEDIESCTEVVKLIERW